MLAYYIGVLYNTLMKMSELEKTEKWIVGVSGGGDSMALLHMCYEAGIFVVAAHMNYQKRDTADRDMKGVQRFCEEHHIPYVIRMQKEQCHENFQSFARRKRYEFYRELIEQYHAAGVLVAHQLDDHLETYLLQKQRKMIPHTYGLCDHVEIFGCHVVRPLLMYTKAELEEYCHRHNVPFWLDESNLSDAYARNQIRHTIIEQMSRAEKNALDQEIAEQNEQHHLQQQMAIRFLQTWDQRCDTLGKEELAPLILYTWIEQNCGYAISAKEQKTLCAMMKQANNWTRSINSTYDIRKEYGTLCILNKEWQPYSYMYPELCYTETPYFTIQDHGEKIESITLRKEDFPITIRAYQPNDAIILRFGTKKLNRWFIDRKIPLQERKKWPVVENVAGNIIFVPKIGCDIAHFSNNPNAFVIK